MFIPHYINPLIMTIIVLLLVIFVGFVMLRLIYAVHKARLSRSWLMTKGRIVSSTVISIMSLCPDCPNDVPIYVPTIVYEYSADGQSYRGSEIKLGGREGEKTPNFAENAVEKYRAGRLVPVFYNPTSPDEAVLERSIGGINLMVLIMLGMVEEGLLVFLILGITGHLA